MQRERERQRKTLSSWIICQNGFQIHFKSLYFVWKQSNKKEKEGKEERNTEERQELKGCELCLGLSLSHTHTHTRSLILYVVRKRPAFSPQLLPLSSPSSSLRELASSFSRNQSILSFSSYSCSCRRKGRRKERNFPENWASCPFRSFRRLLLCDEVIRQYYQ